MLNDGWLVHTVKYFPHYGIEQENSKPIVLKRVKFDINYMSYNASGNMMEAGMGNYQLLYKPGVSTKFTGIFAIGDVIEFSGNEYTKPIRMRVTNINVFWIKGKVDHIQLWGD